jgi:hypothetical protein
VDINFQNFKAASWRYSIAARGVFPVAGDADSEGIAI